MRPRRWKEEWNGETGLVLRAGREQNRIVFTRRCFAIRKMMLGCDNIRLNLLFNKDKDKTRQAHTHHSEVLLLVFESLDASAVFCAS